MWLLKLQEFAFRQKFTDKVGSACIAELWEFFGSCIVLLLSCKWVLDISEKRTLNHSRFEFRIVYFSHYYALCAVYLYPNFLSVSFFVLAYSGASISCHLVRQRSSALRMKESGESLGIERIYSEKYIYIRMTLW